MKKRKKKNTSSQFKKQKIAEGKKAYLLNIRKFLQLYDCGQVFDLIPKQALECLHKERIQSPKIIAGNGDAIEPETLKLFRDLIYSYIKPKEVEIKTGGPSLTIYQYLTIGMTLYCFHESLKEAKYSNAKIIKEILDKNFIFEETDAKVQPILSSILNIFASLESKLNRKLYFINTRFSKYTPGISNINFEMELICYKNKPVTIDIDGNKRSVFPVGWGVVNRGIEWISIKPEFNLSKEPLKVYIQSHALDRLGERIDSINFGIAQLFLFYSLKYSVIVHFNNNLLIEYRLDVKKAGYMVVELITDMAVIRTFLFLTNNGTPEGKKLEQLSGLKKIDKQYLAIDKLSTFQVSDLSQNNELRELFEEAGCGSLFEIKYKSESFDDISISIAAEIAKYIKPLETPVKII